MDTRIIDGVALAARIRTALRDRAQRLSARTAPPAIAVIIVGDDPASRAYVRHKVRACADVGVRSLLVELPADTTEARLLATIAGFNADAGVHGILVQLPLPLHISTGTVLRAVSPDKDVDGFHPLNVGLLVTGGAGFVPCTPAGVMAMLEAEGVNPSGLHAVVVGRSSIVGKPLAHLLLQKGATVTISHSKTGNLETHTRCADILVAAAGRAKLITRDMVQLGAVVIDVGINRLSDGRLVGDCDFASLVGIASRLTPVPGGVGPMTITMLLANTILAAERAAETGPRAAG
jgi:methylenetetrahydrofolate dehydrogenase (NADP+)/methenyltetrahydrofolate cyclohydrolase